jgi:orotate phosphoribosyltransferase
MLTEDQIIDILKINDAYWVHDNNPKHPHAELSNGQCSNAYFNLSKVLCYPAINEILARNLCAKLEKEFFSNDYPEWVVSSSYAAITFGYEVARRLETQYAFAEKDHSLGFNFKRWTIPKNTVVLQIEELITSFNTAKLVRDAVIRDNKYKVRFLPLVGTIVFRPSKFSEEYFIGTQG